MVKLELIRIGFIPAISRDQGAGNSFTYDLIPESFNEVQIIPNPPPQSDFNIYLCQICESNSHYGYECSQRFSLVYEPKPCYNPNFSATIHMTCQLLVCYDDDDDEERSISLKDNIIYGLPPCAAITPSLSTEEPDNSLSMGDEHLDTIPATESDEFIKYSVESLVPIPSESEGVPDNMCDVPFHDNSLPLDVLKDQFEDFSDSNDEFTSTDDDSFSIDNIEYVEASPLDSELVSSEVMEIVIPEVGGIDDDILLTIKDDILREKLLNINLLIANIETLNDNPTPYSDFMTKSSSTSLNSLLEETNTFDNSLPELETFCFNLEEIRVVAVPLLVMIFLFHYMKLSMTIMLKRLVVAVPLLILILLFVIRSSLIFQSTYFLLPIGVMFISSPMNSLTSYFHQSIIVFASRLNPTRGDFTMDMVEDTFPTREPRVHNALPTHPTFQLNLDFILSSESLFAYVASLFEFFVRDKMSQDVIKVGSTIRIPLLYRGEYSQWRERFKNHLEEQTNCEAMINSIQNGDQPLPVIAKESLAGNAPNAPPTLKDPKFWTAGEKKTRKIDRLARSILIQGLPNDIYSLIDSNETAKDLWDALER
uniref:Integrase, catalytic region, zinc finger, CCHC-type, peptidase aspartic, catalytic n=1 Tax=Tanacetum cinerariifolium TaxID=118510 RepID=A0A699H931_TANCI|nr:hypothetical protein [Tanacetum cinerariifolium]